MIGPLVLVVGAIYLALMLLATGAAYRWAANKGPSRPTRIIAAAVGFLFVYLPVFWDHIPTLVMHKYYCETEAGFWIYKTLEQWKLENPGVSDTLREELDGRSSNGAYILNQRFNWAVKKNGPLWLNRWRWNHEVMDGKTKRDFQKYLIDGSGKIVAKFDSSVSPLSH